MYCYFGLNHQTNIIRATCIGGAMRNYENIKAWKLADDLVERIYDRTRSFPTDEKHGLTSQLRRAAASVAANIVEGCSRGSLREYLHHLHIARGSLEEARYFVHLARRLGYLTEAEAAAVTSCARETFACLSGLINAVERECSRAPRGPAIVGTVAALFCLRSLVSGL